MSESCARVHSSVMPLNPAVSFKIRNVVGRPQAWERKTYNQQSRTQDWTPDMHIERSVSWTKVQHLTCTPNVQSNEAKGTHRHRGSDTRRARRTFGQAVKEVQELFRHTTKHGTSREVLHWRLDMEAPRGKEEHRCRRMADRADDHVGDLLACRRLHFAPVFHANSGLENTPHRKKERFSGLLHGLGRYLSVLRRLQGLGDHVLKQEREVGQGPLWSSRQCIRQHQSAALVEE